MTKDLDVVAFGGNAILPSSTGGTIEEQFAIATATMRHIVRLVELNRGVVMTHGNGPIVGNIVIRNEAAKETIPPMPLDVCGADSQGGVGYMLQQVLGNVLKSHGINRDVASIVTQVVVNSEDPGFDNPVKPIGPFYDEDEARRLTSERGWTMLKHDTRGYRRAAPSPYPVEIVEENVIRKLVDAGTIVIAAGGGGIPVVRSEAGGLEGREAVIDKDRTSALLASNLGAERLLILTDVDAVYRNFGTPNAVAIAHASLEETKALVQEGYLPKGSMGSKLDAVISFLEKGGRSAIICKPEKMMDAIDGKSGTTITQ